MNKKLESLNVEETTRDDPESITYTQKELVDLRKKKKDDEAAQKSYLIQLKSFLLDSHQTRRSWEAETTNSARGRGRGVTDSTGALGNSSGAAGAAGSSSGRGRPSSSINGVNRPTPQVVSPAGNVVESDKLPVWRRKERTLSEVSNEATQKCTAAAVVQQQQQQPASSSSSGIFSSNRASSIIGGGAPPFTKLERPPDRRSRKAAAVADDNNSWESSSGAENQLMRLLARVQDTVNIKDLSASQLLAQLQSLASSGGSKQQLSSEDSPHENSDVAAVASCSSPSSSQVPMRPSAPSPPQPLASPQQQPSPPPAAVPTAASLVQRPTSPPTQHPPAVPRQHHPGMPQQQQQQPLHTLPHAPNVAPQYSTMPRGHMKESSVGDEGVKTGNSAHIKSPAHLEMLIQYLKQAQLNQPPPPPPPKVLPSVQRFQKLPEIHPTMSYSAASRRQPTTTTTNSGMEDLIDNLIDRVVNKKNRPDDELINSAWHENTAYHKPFAPKDAVAFHEDERFDERFNDNTNNNINNEGNSTLAYMLRKGTKAAAIDESTAAAEVSSYNNNNNNNNNHHLHHHHHHPSSSTTSSLQDPAIVLGGASTNVITLYDRVWEYYDPHGRIQGPFTSIQMRQWANQNHFPPDLRLRYGPNLPWKPYSELFPASETNPPFTHFPIVTPTTRPPPPPPPPPPAPFGIMPQQKTASCASIMTTNLRSMLGLVQRSGASHDQPPPPPTTNHYHHHEGREMSPIKNKGKASTPPCPSMFPTLSDSVSGGVIGVVASSKNNVVLPSKLPDGKSKWKNNGATTSAGAVVSKSSLDESEFPEPSAAVFTKSTTKIKNNLAPASSTKPADLGKWSKKSLPEFFNETSTRPVKSAWFSEKLPLTSLNIAGPIEQFDQIPKSMPAVVATQPQPPSEEAAAAVIQKPSPPNVDVAEVVKLMKMCRVEFDVAMIEFLKHYETTEEVLDFLRDNLSLVGERAETFAEEFIALMKNPFTTVIYGRTSKISGGKASSGKKAKKRVVALDPSMLGFNEQNTRIMQGTIDYGE